MIHTSKMASHSASRTWALVLAGGESSRSRALTWNANGIAIPKQYCSVRGGRSLLGQAIARAALAAPSMQTCAVVAAQHRCWWGLELASLPQENIFVQPDIKGSAHGILLSLLYLESRDPHATVLMLPSDHYIRDDTLLARSLRQIARLAGRSDHAVYLLGAKPDRADTELGYIVPAARTTAKPTRVLGFVEAPDPTRVRHLLRAGALWNMFIVAGSVRALLALYHASHAESVLVMRAAIRGRDCYAIDPGALAAAYHGLPSVDFSHDLLEAQAARLQVLRTPACGWNDLGKPKRTTDTMLCLESLFEPAYAAN